MHVNKRLWMRRPWKIVIVRAGWDYCVTLNGPGLHAHADAPTKEEAVRRAMEDIREFRRQRARRRRVA
jgi:hypothetical protein